MKRLITARVLDLTNESGVFCTKLLAAMGADVIRVEPPGGDPTRRIGPFYHDTPDPEKSLHWFHYNLDKRSVTLNLTTADGQALFKRLVQTAAIVVECFPPGYLDSLGLGYEQLRAVNPAIIVTSITPFGQTGPYASYKGSDAIAAATAGLMSQSGTQDKPPVHASLPLSYGMTSVQAAVGTLLAHFYQRRTGKGQRVDVSQQEATAWAQFPNHVAWKAEKVIPMRNGDCPVVPGYPVRKIYFECTDGYAAAYPTYWSHMAHALEWMKEAGLGQALEESGVLSYDSNSGGTFPPSEVMDKVNDIFGDLALKYSKADLFKEGQKRGMQVAPIRSMGEIIEDEHLQARDFFIRIEHPELGETVTYGGPPFKMDDIDIGYHRRAPFIGEHNDDIYKGELGLSDEDLSRFKQASVI